MNLEFVSTNDTVSEVKHLYDFTVDERPLELLCV